VWHAHKPAHQAQQRPSVADQKVKSFAHHALKQALHPGAALLPRSKGDIGQILMCHSLLCQWQDCHTLPAFEVYQLILDFSQDEKHDTDYHLV
jgi:hypothetical protein